jgi:twinkle protein
MRHGIRGLVIDPYNEIEHHRPASVTETEYVSQLLGKVKRFAQSNDVHVWFVSHPAKMPRDGNSLPPPTLYDISGSANWANKADLGVVVHRDPGAMTPLRGDIRKFRRRTATPGQKPTAMADCAATTARMNRLPPRCSASGTRPRAATDDETA